MVSEKKPSIYSDRGTIGSAEELDEYGVWVKSEPQELSAGGESTGASPPDFDTDFDDLSPDMDLAVSGGPAAGEPQIEEIDLSEAEADFRQPVSRRTEKNAVSVIEETPADEGFDIMFDEIDLPPGDSLTEESSDITVSEESLDISAAEETGETDDLSPGEMDGFGETSLADDTGLEPSSEVAEETFASGDTSPELSTQLLMKIADELSSIRAELSHLKKEFAGIRAETEKNSAPKRNGFFSEEDDEKIALTGDELDNIMQTVDFTEETGESGEQDGEVLLSEPGGIADTGPAETRASDGSDAEEEEIVIDFDDLGIDLNVNPGDFDKLHEDLNGFSSLDLTESPETETSFSGDLSIDLGGEDFVSDDLNALSTDLGAYEEDLLVEDPSGEELILAEDEILTGDETPAEEEPPVTDETLALDEILTEEEPPAPDETLALDEILTEEEPSAPDETLALDEILTEEEPPATDETLALDEILTGDETPVAEETPAAAEPPAADDPPAVEDNITRVIRVLNSLVGEDTPPAAETPAQDNITVEENLFSGESGGEDSGEIADSELLRQLRIDGAEPMTSVPEDISYLEEETAAGEMETGELSMDISLDEDQDFDAASLDLSEAVIDEPDLSAGITENPVEEPMLDAISLEGIEDLNIDLEDDPFEPVAEDTGEEMDISVSEDGQNEMPDLEITLGDEETGTGDDGFARVIPEGFEAEAEKSPIPFDDDMDGALELGEETVLAGEENAVIADSPAPADVDVDVDAAAAVDEPVPVEENMDIPAGLKSELKTVLSYMDQLLESLPEDKIEEFAKSEYFDTYKKLFKELGLV